MEELQGASRPLAGIKVLDFTTVMSGPFSTRMLADLGADVIKVETMTGDQVRGRPPLRDGASTYFAHLNAGKRSISLNLKAPEAVEIVKDLIAGFDIVVENFRPGVMKRFGLDYDVLSAINPRLIYCAVSGYGQTGPRAKDPAYAPVIHAGSGFDLVVMDYQNGAVERPANTGIFIADVLGGVYAFGAIQTALYHREKTGRGQMVDVSMLEAMASMLVFETQLAQNPAPRRPIYRPLKTADSFLVVAPTSARNFEQLADAIGHPEWRTDPRYSTVPARDENWDELMAEIEAWTSVRTSAEAEEILSAGGVPCGPYRQIGEVMDDPQILARGFYRTIEDRVGAFRIPGMPFRMSGANVEPRNLVAGLGEHGAEVLREELGVDAARIQDLKAAGVLG